MASGSIQPSPPLPSQPVSLLPPEYTTPSITIILTIILLFLFVGFFSIYFCRCLLQNLLYTWHIRHGPGGTHAAANVTSSSPGLDPLIIESFPSFSYSNVKNYRREKYGLECAICLVEFVDSDILRLLTSCCHVFHQECIDLWLQSHKTCPVCRRNLDSPINSPVKSPSHGHNNVHDDAVAESELGQDCLRITINEDNQDEARDSVGKTDQIVAPQKDKVQYFCRSHSTGHNSFVNESKEEEKGDHKFTLRLPENVKSNIIKKHNSSISWSTFGDYKANVSTSGIAKSST